MPKDDPLAAELKDVTELLRLNPDDLELYFRRGVARAQMEDFAGAIEDFSYVIAKDPGDHLARVNRGGVYLARGEYLRAIADFDDALVLVPDDALTLNDRGVARRRLGRLDAALEDFRQAWNTNPDLLGPRINASRTLMDLGRYADVVAVCTDGLARGPSQDLEQLRATALELLDEGKVPVMAASDRTAPATPGPLLRAATVYPPRDGSDPELTDELLEVLQAAAPPFTKREDLGVPPTGHLHDVVRCIRPSDLDESLRALFQFAFPGFFGRATTPTAEDVEAKLRSGKVEAPFKYRRFAGDISLPRGRYYSLDRPGAAAGDGTLARELLAYAETSHTGELDAVDLSDPAAAAVRSSYQPLFAAGPVPESIVLRFMSRPGCAGSGSK